MGLCFNAACVPLDFILTPKVVDPLVLLRLEKHKTVQNLAQPIRSRQRSQATRVGGAASPADPLPAVADPRQLAAVSIIEGLTLGKEQICRRAFFAESPALGKEIFAKSASLLRARLSAKSSLPSARVFALGKDNPSRQRLYFP
jgi:hypothetical protein